MNKIIFTNKKSGQTFMAMFTVTVINGDAFLNIVIANGDGESIFHITHYESYEQAMANTMAENEQDFRTRTTQMWYVRNALKQCFRVEGRGVKPRPKKVNIYGRTTLRPKRR